MLVGRDVRLQSVVSVHDNPRIRHLESSNISAVVRMPSGNVVTLSGFTPDNDATITSFAAASAGDIVIFATEQTDPVFVSGHYVVKDSASGRRMLVEVAAVHGERYSLRSPLPCDISHASQLLPAEVCCIVDAADNTQCGVAVAQWTVIGEDGPGDSVYSWSDTFQIVKRLPHWGLNQSKLLQQWPWIARHRDRDDLDLSNLLQTGLELYILPLLRARGIAEEDLISTILLEPAHSTACAYHVALNDSTIENERREEMKRRIHTLVDNAMASPGWFESAQNKDALVPTPEGPPNGRRYVRLVR